MDKNKLNGKRTCIKIIGIYIFICFAYLILGLATMALIFKLFIPFHVDLIPISLILSFLISMVYMMFTFMWRPEFLNDIVNYITRR